MTKIPLVVTYYTEQTPYQWEAYNLVESCKKWNIPIHAEAVRSFGSWELNCAYKPFFLMSKLKEFQRPLLWVDADAIFKGKLDWIPEFSADFATRISKQCHDHHPSKVITGTVFVNTSAICEEILRAWSKEAADQLLNPDRKEEFWDQIALRNVLKKFEKKAQIASLPLSHTKIFDKEKDALEEKQIIIEHYQASRRYKKLIA